MSGVWGETRFFRVDALQSLTFDNDANPITLFTVTGHVIIRMIAVCTVDVTSAAVGNIEVGISGATGTIIPTTVSTAVDAFEIWHDNTPDSEIEALSTIKEFIITAGNDIILTPSAQIDSGTINFYLEYTPLSADGAVVAA